jgi:uncharacterized protein YqjF (DUF2071 family)
MTKQRTFLTAEWNHLLMLNYAVDPSLLRQLVPAGTELDQFDAKTYVSLVGFEFNETRISGVAIPFHRSFEEVNLRFYVKRGSKRGVVFIRELVPRYAVAAIARFAFGEKYSCVPMSHRIHTRAEKDVVEAEYAWGVAENRCLLRIETDRSSFLPADGSLSQFITEHYWGYASQSNGACLEYEVQHPQWRVREAKTAQFSGDATRFYGDALGKAVMRPPDSAFLAEGSPVTVFKGARIS